MHYTVVMRDKLDDLIAEVNRALAQGWRPQGGIATSVTTGNWSNVPNLVHYAQALVWAPPTPDATPPAL